MSAPPPGTSTWPLTEAHRRKAAEVAAWAIDRAHGVVMDAQAETKKGAGCKLSDVAACEAGAARYLAIADVADRLSKPWSPER